MPFTFYAFAEAAILASSLSLDAFTAGFSYGTSKIKIPLLSVFIINIICISITGLSLFLGAILAPHLPHWLSLAISFAILFVMGMIKLLDSITKSIIKKHNNINKQFEISMFNFKFILNLYAHPEDADIDESKIITSAEAAALAISLSLDGMAIGFGAALADVNGAALLLCSLITDATAIILGCHIGNKIAHNLTFNISWISGAVLMGLAFSKLI